YEIFTSLEFRRVLFRSRAQPGGGLPRSAPAVRLGSGAPPPPPDRGGAVNIREVDPHELGRLGERFAAAHLRRDGMQILERNWRRTERRRVGKEARPAER